jgi:hypothetical protein
LLLIPQLQTRRLDKPVLAILATLTDEILGCLFADSFWPLLSALAQRLRDRTTDLL